MNRDFSRWVFGTLLALMSLAALVLILPMVGIEIHSQYFGIGRAPCRNAFGHQADMAIELRLDRTYITLISIPKECHCSLCKALGHRP
jgi:hypothetical protein